MRPTNIEKQLCLVLGKYTGYRKSIADPNLQESFCQTLVGGGGWQGEGGWQGGGQVQGYK